MSKNKKEVVGTKYFLILFAKFGENKKLLTDILYQFETILSSNFLKFQEGEDFVITHFETDESLKGLREFCGLVLDETIENYILFPNNKNITLSLPNEFKEHLLDLENDNLNIEPTIIDLREIEHDEDEDDDDDILSEIYRKQNKNNPLEQLLNTLSTTQTKMSLDELLDKVQKNGLKSLTKKEKEQLYDYSKRI
jgi:hypothetical protein